MANGVCRKGKESGLTLTVISSVITKRVSMKQKMINQKHKDVKILNVSSSIKELRLSHRMFGTKKKH